ncbi:MAG: S-methyl-5'-thioinosine phosphorylase [Burkholderiales bacterium]
MLGIIGGSGLNDLANLAVTRREVVRTPYGEPSAPLLFGRLAGREVVFVARHGHGHTIPPHEVNYRANIWALQAQKVSCVVSVASVGGIRADLGPGVLCVPDQILDYTYGRRHTFVSREDGAVKHIDFTHPYCERLRQDLARAAKAAAEPLLMGGTYAATQGPRLETAAEVNRLERDGADMVGMTGMPEAGLARELDVRYAALTVVANWSAGRVSSAEGIAMSEINAVLKTAMARVRRILEQLVVQ